MQHEADGASDIRCRGRRPWWSSLLGKGSRVRQGAMSWMRWIAKKGKENNEQASKLLRVSTNLAKGAGHRFLILCAEVVLRSGGLAGDGVLGRSPGLLLDGRGRLSVRIVSLELRRQKGILSVKRARAWQWGGREAKKDDSRFRDDNGSRSGGGSKV